MIRIILDDSNKETNDIDLKEPWRWMKGMQKQILNWIELNWIAFDIHNCLQWWCIHKKFNIENQTSFGWVVGWMDWWMNSSASIRERSLVDEWNEWMLGWMDETCQAFELHSPLTWWWLNESRRMNAWLEGRSLVCKLFFIFPNKSIVFFCFFVFLFCDRGCLKLD